MNSALPVMIEAGPMPLGRRSKNAGGDFLAAARLEDLADVSSSTIIGCSALCRSGAFRSVSLASAV